MLNLLTFFVGIVTIFLLARYNKSNKLFWLLFISMMTGFAGGTIVTRLYDSSKKDYVDTVTQNTMLSELPACALFAQTPDNTDLVPSVEGGKSTTAFYTECLYLSTPEYQSISNPRDCGLDTSPFDTS